MPALHTQPGHDQQNDLGPASAYASRRQASGGVRPVLVVVIALLALVLGLVIGTLLLGGLIPRAQATVPATLTASQLDTKVGSYTYQGTVYEIIAQEAIEDSVSLDSVRQDDGTYATPSADMIVSYARNRILAGIVADAGITISDEDLSSYLESLMGTSDIATIASGYGMSESQATTILTEAAAVKKLRDQTIGEIPDAPTAPVAPEDGDTETANADYATYIINLLGDNWDAATGTWANTDNAYYSALSDATFSADSANYEAAQLAYYVAYASYQSQTSAISAQWTDYVNQYLVEGAITVDTLLS